MKALVTGGTGFIGSHLVDRLLEQGFHTRVLRRPTSSTQLLTGKQVEYADGDLLDRTSLRKACEGVDLVFHLAALPRDYGPEREFQAVNVEGTRNLLDACVAKKVPSIFLMSSAAVYGFPRTGTPITEDPPYAPTPKYGQSKVQAEELLWHYGQTHDLHVAAVRSPLVTGPRDRLVAPFIISAMRAQRLFLIGDGSQVVSLSDGRDVASCLLKAAETHRSAGQAYNVKSFDCSIKELLDHIASALHVPPPRLHRSYYSAFVLASFAELVYGVRGKQPPLTRHKVKVLGHTRVLDIGKAHRDLGFRPHYGVQHTVEDMVSWFQTRPTRTDPV